MKKKNIKCLLNVYNVLMPLACTKVSKELISMSNLFHLMPLDVYKMRGEYKTFCKAARHRQCWCGKIEHKTQSQRQEDFWWANLNSTTFHAFCINYFLSTVWLELPHVITWRIHKFINAVAYDSIFLHTTSFDNRSHINYHTIITLCQSQKSSRNRTSI